MVGGHVVYQVIGVSLHRLVTCDCPSPSHIFIQWKQPEA